MKKKLATLCRKAFPKIKTPKAKKKNEPPVLLPIDKTVKQELADKLPVLHSIEAGAAGGRWLRVTAAWPIPPTASNGHAGPGGGVSTFAPVQFDYLMDDVYGVTLLNCGEGKFVLEVLNHPAAVAAGCCSKPSNERWKREVQLFSVPDDMVTGTPSSAARNTGGMGNISLPITLRRYTAEGDPLPDDFITLLELNRRPD